MKIITYYFCNGDISKVEVSDTFYEQFLEIEREERLANRRETRRHISLDFLHDSGIEMPDKELSALDIIIKEFSDKRLKDAIATLLPVQIELIKKVFIDRTPIQDIAKEYGVVNSAISNRLKRIYDKLRKFLI